MTTKKELEINRNNNAFSRMQAVSAPEAPLLPPPPEEPVPPVPLELERPQPALEAVQQQDDLAAFLNPAPAPAVNRGTLRAPYKKVRGDQAEMVKISTMIPMRVNEKLRRVMVNLPAYYRKNEVIWKLLEDALDRIEVDQNKRRRQMLVRGV